MNLHHELYKKTKTETIGKIIKKERLVRGWNQAKLAEKLGLSVKQGRYIIKDYETRGIYPPPQISKMLAQIFKIGKTYFYDDYFDFLDKNCFEILKGWRETNRFTQNEAAKTLKVSTATFNRWENGKKISRNNYKKLKEIIYRL